jgi:hypothetical protein
MVVVRRAKPELAREKRTGRRLGRWGPGDAAGDANRGPRMGEERPQAVGTQSEPLGDREGGSHCYSDQIDTSSPFDEGGKRHLRSGEIGHFASRMELALGLSPP